MVVLLVLSAGYEWLFLGHAMNLMDEGWPLHAAMELQAGGTLYDDVFWVFPPGHLIPAWIGYAWAPPGLVGARIVYAAFCVALCVTLYLAARRFMPPRFALLAGLLAVVAAPRSHSEQLIFGYRYLALSVVVLLLFDLRLRRDDVRWLFAAGVMAGVTLFFRITPAFAASVAIGVGILASSRSWRRWLVDGGVYSAGLILVWIPVLAYFQHSVGLERFWSEAVVRPVEMTALQSLPMPPISQPGISRQNVSLAFAALGFRVYPLVYLAVGGLLLHRWLSAFRAGRPFDQVFFLTFVVFGAVFLSRSYGRADIPHLDSAIPPVLVLIAWVASRWSRLPESRWLPRDRWRGIADWAVIAICFVAWTLLNSSERFLDRDARMGKEPIETAAGPIKVRKRSLAHTTSQLIPVIQDHASPDDTIFVLSHAPLIHVLAERHSPGYFDVVMPGTFRDAEEERRMLEILEAEPPAVVVYPRQHFDRIPIRGLHRTAPSLDRWVREDYRVIARSPFFAVLVPKQRSSRTGDRDR